MEQFLSYFTFDTFGIVGLSTLLLLFLIQLFFYVLYYRKPAVEQKKRSESNTGSISSQLPSVSVIIVAKEESDALAKNLPIILNQDYPDYEVVVVNDGFTNESDILLEQLKREYTNLYSTFSPISYENDSRRQRVLSLTIGIKAATKDVLLFTEADTCPLSSNWISSMMRQLTPDKDIVLGYCRYKTEGKALWKKVAIFDNLLFSLQYLSKAILNKPFIGVSRNIAYRRNVFFDNKGFSSSLKYDNADEVFVNTVMSSSNTAVSLEESSFVLCDLDSYSLWRFIKRNYMKTKMHLQKYTPRIFGLETFSRYLFYIALLALVVYTSYMSLWVYLAGGLLLFVIRQFFQFSILKKGALAFDTECKFFNLPLLDLIQPLYNNSFYRYSKKKAKKAFKQ